MNKATVSMLSALCFLSLESLPVDAKVIFHFVGNGNFASFSNYSGGSDYSFFNVTQGGTPSNPGTTISYYASACDYATGICQGVNAYGPIPNADFAASGKTATLITNTTSDPGFSAFRWTFNQYTGEYSETPIDLGVVNLVWKAAGLYAYHSVGTSASTYLNLTWKSTGRVSTSYAPVSGTISGNPVAWTDASMGTSFSNEINLERQ